MSPLPSQTEAVETRCHGRRISGLAGYFRPLHSPLGGTVARDASRHGHGPGMMGGGPAGVGNRSKSRQTDAGNWKRGTPRVGTVQLDRIFLTCKLWKAQDTTERSHRALTFLVFTFNDLGPVRSSGSACLVHSSRKLGPLTRHPILPGCHQNPIHSPFLLH